MTAESRYVDVDGVRVHYLDSGDDGTGRPPIVFSPGVSDVADDYHQVLPELGRRTIVIDYRGRGRSDSPPSGYSMDHHVADLAAVVDDATDGPVHVMTFSRGTCYAVGYTLAHPDRVLSLAIGDYPVREIMFPDVDGFAADFLARTWRGTPVHERISETAFRGILDEAVARDLWDPLAALSLPLLVVRAGHGGPITEDDWLRYADRFPDCHRITFDDSPHDLFRRDRFRFPRLVRGHLDHLERA